MKVHNKYSVIKNLESILRPRIKAEVRNKLFGRKGSTKSTLDVLEVRNLLGKEGKHINDSDISALYIPSANRKLKNVSQKKIDEEIAEKERLRKHGL